MFFRPQVRRAARHSILAAAVVGVVLSASTPASGVSGFGDVGAGRFYTAPVQWMVDEEVTTGVSPTCFAPDEYVTRGQAAAFMWRMEGEPGGSPHHGLLDIVSGY